MAVDTLVSVEHGNIAAAFKHCSHETGLVAITEWRFQVSPSQFRGPDVVITRGRAQEQTLTKAPLEAKAITIFRQNQIEPVAESSIRIDGTNFEIPLQEIFD